ncbi:K02A2.6-like [Cordylochernes scorpioides]|uniref:RNA-directed DNA polymerase n=1 Tax=Cordylochernes scorpioides TaxID=51811 RepID=A0ABY6KBG8_9ARAC|nr:K02A2.6-like [Cordylochernes scorpioides]
MPGDRKRRQFKQTDAFTRGIVIGLKRAGWSIRQIAADTHLGASTVHRLWKRWLEQGNVAIHRNVGATRVTSARVDRRILRQAVVAPQATCTAILQHVQDTLDHSISTRTISRRLVANGLHSCRPLRRLPLIPPNRRQRLEWCRARSTWMMEWHRVVFSDESRFCLSSDSRRVRVWRRRGERSNPAAIVERPTVRQRGIMGTMTAQRYVDDVLRPVTLPYLQGVPNALYQQDNARPHTARISQQALQDVQMLPWPPYSPDLSPIEHVWDIIGRRLYALPQPRSEDELWQMVEREWRAIPQDAIRTLIDSLPRRVAACIAVRGKEAYNIFEHLDLSDEQRNNSDEIINALTHHFTPKINIIYERSIFNQTNQETNESIEQYICRLRKLSSTCNYGAMTEEMIRDRLVLGIIDKQTKRQLISDPQLTLQKAIDVCKANESANKQIENLTKNTQEEVNKLNIRKKTVNQNKKSSHEPNKMKKNIPCRYCATFHEHNRQKCPAWNQTCRKCNKKNHWAKVCKSRTRTVQSLESQNSNDEQEDCYSLEYVSEISARKLMTKLELELNGYKESIICQIDTGATVNVLNFEDLCKIVQDGNPSLKPSYIKLRCYGGEILKPRGQIKINCSHQSKQHPIVFQVIDHWEKPILSAETCQKLNLIEIKADLCQIESTWTKQNNLLDKYKDIFEGIECLQGGYKLETDPTIKPIKQAPRRVPITLRKELKEKLIDMEKKNIIAKVDYPTDWISNLVLVKSTKKLRICIDPRELNVALKRAEYPIPTIEEIIPNLQNAKIFTVVDTKDGFWNVKLSDESSNLTTFWTPFGRYKFLRMPFGLKTASEEYQRRLYEIFQGDSYEEALKDHDRNLENLFKTARQANLKFNINKVKLRLKEVKYLGHIITPHGLKPDPEKVKALKEMPHPESITELKSFLGFATYLCKFMPNISMISEPLRKLTMKNSTWSWSKNHQAAFEQIKDLASKAPVLRYFDADKSIAIQCDASKHGLGATLLQESQPIIFASRSLSKTEQNYAQIEKECLAIVFACERFHQYILGKCQVIVQTDHKPLLSIFKKSILKAPQRLQRMLLRLQRYNLELEHVQGSQMHLADIFSRACIKDVRNENLKYDVCPIDIIYKEIATVNVMETLSVCSDTVLRIREETSSDPILCEVKKRILNGWPPNKNQTSMLTREYWNFREELKVQDGIILKNDRIVIPNKLRKEMIIKTHQGHIGINSSMRRARDNIFWPGMNAQIGQEIENCSICLSNSQNQIFFEVECLENTTSEYIIECCKRQFSRYGIPQIIVSDNGRQFTSTEFQKFSKEWQFQHSTSSPLHSQGNGKAEAAVKIAKNLPKKSKQENIDFWQNLLNWRNTPTIDIDSSPVQRIMSRRTRAILPIHPNLLKPSIPENIPDKISIKRQQAKYYYDRKSKNLPDLDIGQEVYVRTPNTTPSWSKANITNEHNTRSYDVNIHGRTYRRNRTWIKPQQASANQKSTNNQEEGRKESIDQEQTVSNCLPSTSSAGGDNIVKSTRNAESNQRVTAPRITLDRLNTFGDEIFGDPKVLKSYYYGISDLAVGGRCKCNGHAGECVVDPNSAKLRCRCAHFTTGADCEQCLPFYNDQPWRKATANDAYECKQCSCNGRSQKCYFDPELWEQTGHGGHCMECSANTDGPHCERCKENYYQLDDGRCVHCGCDPTGSRSLQCNHQGECLCKPGVEGRHCDRCAANYYEFSNQGCKPCGCSAAGSVANKPTCDPLTGVCVCKGNVEGQRCDQCKPGFFDLKLHNEFGCLPCFCYGHSSICMSAPGFSELSIDSSFTRDKEKWETIDIKGQEVPFQHNSIGQNIGVNAHGRDAVYFLAPPRYLTDQRNSYNQFLKFSLRIGEESPRATLEDIIVESGNGRKISQPIFGQGNHLPSLHVQEYKFRFHEDPLYGWNPRLSSPDFISVLSNITAIKIKATYVPMGSGFLDNVRLETAHRAPGPDATWVEICTCPEGYVGQFCESCAPGYRREGLAGRFSRCIPCDCHGHAEYCDPDSGRCICQDNTAGDTCDRCAPGYYGNALQGTEDDCQPCPCPNRGACVILPNEQVACLQCPQGYAGHKCDLCVDGYFGDPLGAILGMGKECAKCECNGNIDHNAVGNCNTTTGECLKCIHHTDGSQCEKCLPGFFGNALGPLKGDCRACECFPAGTQSDDGLCEEVTGQCPCKEHVSGRRCDRCQEGYYGLHGGEGCRACNCDAVGALNASCDVYTGQCHCRTGVTGLRCDSCLPLHYGFSPDGCQICDCDIIGAIDPQCEPDGQCVCRPNVEGRRCERCKENTYNKQAGCVSCPHCYDLVQDAVNLHRAKLRDLAHLLRTIKENPRTVDDKEFEVKLEEIMRKVDKLLEDAKDAQGSGNNVAGKMKDQFKLLEDVRKIVAKTQDKIVTAGGLSTQGKLNVSQAEQALAQAEEILNIARKAVESEGLEALKKAEERSEMFGQHNVAMSDIARKARQMADEQEKLAGDIHATAEQARNITYTSHAKLVELEAGINIVSTDIETLDANTTQWQADFAPKEMAASDLRNRRHVQLLLTWSTNAAHSGLGALTGVENMAAMMVRTQKLSNETTDKTVLVHDESLVLYNQVKDVEVPHFETDHMYNEAKMLVEEAKTLNNKTTTLEENLHEEQQTLEEHRNTAEDILKFAQEQQQVSDFLP